MNIEYSMFLREHYAPDSRWERHHEWDVFISAFDVARRVQNVFAKARAKHKLWVVHREYGYLPTEVPAGVPLYNPPRQERESEFIQGLLDQVALWGDLKGLSICIDITGFMRPHLMYLVRYLDEVGVEALDILYSEPAQYSSRERTPFAIGNVADPRQVDGFAGVHDPGPPQEDLLIVGVGYEHELIIRVAAAKEYARKLGVFAFPPLQADFYQESVLRAAHADEAMGVYAQTNPAFAPASDPFATASVLHELYEEERARRPVRNLYLSPLATKAQALGFALFYIFECKNEPVSILYPFADRYGRGSATGYSGTWRYRVEFPSSVAAQAQQPRVRQVPNLIRGVPGFWRKAFAKVRRFIRW